MGGWIGRRTAFIVLIAARVVLIPRRVAPPSPPTHTLLSPQGWQQVFWQWLNQSYNAGFNYANRNASVPVDTMALLTSYGTAAGVAMGMSAGLGRVVSSLQPRAAGGGLAFKLLSRGLPWFAVASAGTANVLAMRYKEGVEGITVYDAAGAPAGTSVAAGRACLAQVALTRAVLPMPILLVPPFILDALRASRAMGPLMARSAGTRVAVELTIFAAFLQAALPFAVALFPQTGTIAARDLEQEFRGRRGADGNIIESYTYNKGI